MLFLTRIMCIKGITSRREVDRDIYSAYAVDKAISLWRREALFSGHPAYFKMNPVHDRAVSEYCSASSG
jgi:hypothetical protein